MLLQLWVRPALAHLLPAPIAYYMIKQLSHYTGFTQFLLNKIISLKTLIWTWMEEFLFTDSVGEKHVPYIISSCRTMYGIG